MNFTFIVTVNYVSGNKETTEFNQLKLWQAVNYVINMIKYREVLNISVKIERREK